MSFITIMYDSRHEDWVVVKYESQINFELLTRK